MICVFQKHIKSGHESCINKYNSYKEAIEKITLLYNIDKSSEYSKGEFYYFLKEI